MNKWLAKFFEYLNKYHVPHYNLPTLHQAGLNHFKAIIFDEMKLNVGSSILQQISKERNGEVIDQGLMRRYVEIFETMGMGTLDVYVSDFEVAFLEGTKEYYAAKAQEWIASDSTPDYLVKAERALRDEASRVTSYLNSATEAKLVLTVQTELLSKQQSILLEKEGSGLRIQLADNKTEVLSRMYSLFCRIENGLGPIADIVQQYITAIGVDIVHSRETSLKELLASGMHI
jgi:cullin 1